MVIYKMRFVSVMILLSVALIALGCGKPEPATPLQTFKTYVKAIKQKDTTTMKLLLSNATIRMHEQQAKAQGVTVDDIVKRETLFAENQSTVEYRNEKIDGLKATIQVKNSFEVWETVPFVFEDGAWKIDKQGYANQVLQDVDDSQQRLDDIINSGPNIDGTPTPY